MKDNDILNFGKYKGKPLANVPASYLVYLYENKICFGELWQYIKDNLHILRIESKNEINSQKLNRI